MSKFIERQFKAAIEAYTEQSVSEVKFHEDPVVAGTWAARATLAEGEVDFLLIAAEVPGGWQAEPSVLAMHLDECQFTAWPPQVHRPRMFY